MASNNKTVPTMGITPPQASAPSPGHPPGPKPAATTTSPVKASNSPGRSPSPSPSAAKAHAHHHGGKNNPMSQQSSNVSDSSPIPTSSAGRSSLNNRHRLSPRDSLEIIEDIIAKSDKEQVKRLSKKSQRKSRILELAAAENELLQHRHRSVMKYSTLSQQGFLRRKSGTSIASAFAVPGPGYPYQSYDKRPREFNPCFCFKFLDLGSWCLGIGTWQVVCALILLSLKIFVYEYFERDSPKSVELDPIQVIGTSLMGVSGLFLIFGVTMKNKILALVHTGLTLLSSLLIGIWAIILILQLSRNSESTVLQILCYSHLLYIPVQIYFGVCSLGWWSKLRADGLKPKDPTVYTDLP